jgi:hypothetical protein
LLAPLFARRAPVAFAAALILALAVTILPFVPEGGIRELYDRTIGYQASRPSPFSAWGRAGSLDWLQTATKAAAAVLALLAAFMPRRPDVRGVAALAAAVLITLQIAATHWFYLYVIWFVPFVFAAVFGGHARILRDRPASEREAERQPVYA